MDASLGKEILLALSTGFAVEADDGWVGVVETPLFPPDRAEPDYLVLRVGRVHPRRPIVSTLLVERVDPHARIVRVHGSRTDIERLPERLPLAV
jgi:hypothetical protein